MSSKEGAKMEHYIDQESATQPLNASRRCCCFPTTTTAWWDKIKSKTTTTTSSTSSMSTRLWDNGITALKKFREWSELVAGPKWKTFIRRFNRPVKNRGAGGGNFQYDPLSYALNFDDGVGQNGDFDDGGGVRDFSARYVSSVSVSGD